MKVASVLLICFQLSCSYLNAQDSLSNKRLKPLIIASSAVYAGSMVALNQLWYSDFEKQSFQFFNDNSEWKQMDKLGHFYSAFHLSNLGYRGLLWAGVEEQKSVFWGSMVSVFVLTPIEIFDGFSTGYGASSGDLLANTGGMLLFYGQQKLWQEIRLHPKYSFNRSGYAPLRPQILGAGISEELFKDYNAQTYWLSIDLSKFSSFFPKWLNLAVGYGAEGMVFANDEQNIANGFHPVRNYYLSLDLDLNEYKGSSKFVNTLIDFINIIKIPSPTIQLTSNKFRLHSFYY